MKLHNRLAHWFLYFSACTLFWGCLEYEITTRVMPDGRMSRIIIVKGDSTDIFTGSFRVPADSSWTLATRHEIRNHRDIKEEKVFVYEATKEFKSYNDLNAYFYNDTSFSDHTSVKVNLDKRFRWFYTYYVYTETYSMLFPFRSVPIQHYLSSEELRIHLADEKEIYFSPEHDRILFAADSLKHHPLTKSDSLRFKALRDSIENKFETWQKVNIYNDFYTLVTAGLRKLGKDIDTVVARAPFFQWLDTVKTVETGLENGDAFINAAAAYFKVDPDELKATDAVGFGTFNKKFRVAAFSLESYTNQVLMPGRIISTNAGQVDANRVSWTFKTDNFYATDYTMTVESRILNKSFIAGAGLLLVLLTGLALIPVLKNKPR
jgi:hypothetical protein